jgi:predicted secreted protein
VSLTTAIAIYFLIWWVTLFAVLPFGVRPQQGESDMAPGTDPGAPVIPRILTKLVWTTIVSGLIFAACYWVYTRRLITLEDMIRWLGLPP